MNSSTAHNLSALHELLGLRQVPGFYRSTLFLSCLALVAVQPLPWHRILSSAFLLAVVWQPIVEELFFRGCLQGFLSIREWGQRSLAGISIANLLTSMVFTGAHIATHSLLWASLTLFPSLLFGVLRDRSGVLSSLQSRYILFITQGTSC